MDREKKISDIIAVLEKAQDGLYRGVDLYVDVKDHNGIPYGGIGVGYAAPSEEYGVFTGDFLFVPLTELSDDSIDLLWDKLLIRGATVSKEVVQKLTSRVNAALRDIIQEDIKQFLDDGMQHGTVVEALYDAFSAIESGEAKNIQEALLIGASEWYK